MGGGLPLHAHLHQNRAAHIFLCIIPARLVTRAESKWPKLAGRHPLGFCLSDSLIPSVSSLFMATTLSSDIPLSSAALLFLTVTIFHTLIHEVDSTQTEYHAGKETHQQLI